MFTLSPQEYEACIARLGGGPDAERLMTRLSARSHSRETLLRLIERHLRLFIPSRPRGGTP